jgi:hypothetical protein
LRKNWRKGKVVYSDCTVVESRAIAFQYFHAQRVFKEHVFTADPDSPSRLHPPPANLPSSDSVTPYSALLERKDVAPATLPFNLTYIFTATLNLGQPPAFRLSNTTSQRIPTLDTTGVIVPEPILNGTVTGPYFNATITSGLAFPRVYA